jgi:uncharacterized membrane protein
MEYVSAEWVTDERMGTRLIRATGNDGSIWWISSVDSDVPPWPQFLETEAGQAFAAQEPPA